MIALILGAVSYKKMRVDIFPEIKIPTILVTTLVVVMAIGEDIARRGIKKQYYLVHRAQGRKSCLLDDATERFLELTRSGTTD